MSGNTAETREIAVQTVDCRQKRHVLAASLTTFGIGGGVALVVEPQSLTALQNLMRELKTSGKRWRVIGNGSNIVLGDGLLDEIVIHLGKEFAGYSFHAESLALTDIDAQTSAGVGTKNGAENFVLAWAGAPLMTLSRKVSQASLSGLEFAAGIPGAIGGAVKMNAGAHGSQMSDVIRRVFAVDEDGQFFQVEAAELQFSYRHSALPEKSIVVATLLELTPGRADEINSKRSSCLEYRKQTQPLHLPSSGSVFKNVLASSSGTGEHTPSQSLAAGAILESCGLKGERRGGVAFSDLHANWLVRVEDSARAADFDELVELAKQKAKDAFGVDLKTEIIRW